MKTLEQNGISLSKATLSRDAQVDAIRNQLFDVNKYEVPAPRGGFQAPDAVTIYDSDNGRFLGKAGSDYGILKPRFFFDAIISGLDNAGYDYENKKIQYKEINDGRVIEFRIPIKTVVLNRKTAKLNDVMDTYMLCSTSFDGSQASRTAILTERLVCTNGMVINERSAYKSFKHTNKMNVEGLVVTQSMAESIDFIGNFSEIAEKLSNIKIDQKMKNHMIKKITGYDATQYAKMHVARKAIIDGIENGLKFEKDNTGVNDTAWSLFNAFTYHSNHDLDGNVKDSKNVTLTVGTGFKFNNEVQKHFKKEFAKELAI